MLKSTLGFPVATKTGTIPKTTLSVAPSVVNGDVLNLPQPEKGVIWLVNAMVFAATNRQDVAMFDPTKTIRDADGKAVAQGGYLLKSGKSVDF